MFGFTFNPFSITSIEFSISEFSIWTPISLVWTSIFFVSIGSFSLGELSSEIRSNLKSILDFFEIKKLSSSREILDNIEKESFSFSSDDASNTYSISSSGIVFSDKANKLENKNLLLIPNKLDK
uniref:Uncharacterized protein n=1 Tax=Russula abietina TaxID=482377 RepID=A0A2S0U3Y0_9AGAM|nr:hypothetical protein [Russula abietina]AWB36130.1 hypothetical protein [Russula abietina]